MTSPAAFSVFLKDEDFQSCFRQQRRRRQSANSAPDNDSIPIFFGYTFIKCLNKKLI